VKGERQMTETFSTIHNHYDNTNFNDLDTKSNSTIPVTTDHIVYSYSQRTSPSQEKGVP